MDNKCKKDKIKMAHLNRPEESSGKVSQFGYDQAVKVNRFHKSFPEYSVTPLRELKKLAADTGVKGIYIKDESFRFGLNAFKVLGGSYAIGNYIARELGIPQEEIDYNRLTDPEVQSMLGRRTFITATDGNHGRGVAWTASRLKQKSVVYMPKGSAAERLENIRRLGAEASITDVNYDETVRRAYAEAEEKGWVFIQDTAWENYEEIPRWIMQGYTTMAYEAYTQMNDRRLGSPTHIFLQAGVGAMSGAVAGFFADVYGDGEKHPVITVVEPDKADCIYRTAARNDGKLYPVTGDMNTIMAGLACGEPCTLGWEILKDHADYFVSMPDEIAEKGMRVLGNPAGGDPRIVSGESGAAGFGFVITILTDPAYTDLKEQLGIDENSRILCFSTEGDTDKENYKRILQDRDRS